MHNLQKLIAQLLSYDDKDAFTLAGILADCSIVGDELEFFMMEAERFLIGKGVTY